MNHIKPLIYAAILLLTSCTLSKSNNYSTQQIVETDWKNILSAQGAGLEGNVHRIIIKAYRYKFNSGKERYTKTKFEGIVGEWTFNKDGRIAEFIDYTLSQPEHFKSKEVFQYKNTSLAYSKTYDHHDSLIAKTTYRFDHGFIVKKTMVDLREEMQYELINDYTYTDSTRVIVTYRDNAGYKDSRTEYIANGRIYKAEDSLINDKYQVREERELNEHGDVVDIKSYAWDDTRDWRMYQYIYNKQGVWTVQAEGIMCMPSELYEREITYY